TSLFPQRRCGRVNLFVGSSTARSRREQRRNDHKVVGEHRRSLPQVEALDSLGKAALHAATTSGEDGLPMKEADRTALIAGEAPIALVDAYLIDGITDEPVERGFVRIREGLIAEAGPMSAFRKAPGIERIVGLAGHALLPGLID